MTDKKESAEHLLLSAGVKPTSNRILVLREVMCSQHPVSLIELQERIGTIEKSSISRVLSLLLSSHIIHGFEDGRGIVNYELCHGHDNQSRKETHVHFYCERCRKVYCFNTINTPLVDIPSEYEVNSINYMLKGICIECKKK